MALKPIEILKDVIQGDSHTVTIDSVESLGDGKYKLSTENTLYLRTEKEVTIDSVVYRVVDFSINSYVTVAAKDGSDTVVTASSFDIDPPLFLWGNPKMVSAELDIRKKNKATQIYPYIWLVDIHNTRGTTSPSAAIKRTPSFTLLFLDSVKYEKWTIDDHYSQDVYPLNNYLDYFFAILESRRDLFETDDINWTSVNVVNFGDYVVDKGMQERILNDNCTGIRLQIDLPIIKNDCQDIDINRSCPSGSVKNSTDTYSATVPSGGELELDDVPYTDSDGTSKSVPYKTSLVCTPATTPVNSSSVWKTGATLSLNSGDDGNIKRGTGADFYNFSAGKTNGFGGSKTYTGITGGHYDEVAGNYKDVDGNVTTEALAFPDNLMLNWKMWNQVDGEVFCIDYTPIQTGSVASMILASPYTRGGLSGFYVLNMGEYERFFNYNSVVVERGFSWTPFSFIIGNSGVVERVYSSTPYGTNYYGYVSDAVSNQLTPTASATVFVGRYLNLTTDLNL